LGRGAIGSEQTNIDIHTDVVGLKCHVYVFSEMTFVLPVFGEGQVQEVGTAHQHFQHRSGRLILFSVGIVSHFGIPIL
jgi:hypothetical protein